MAREDEGQGGGQRARERVRFSSNATLVVGLAVLVMACSYPCWADPPECGVPDLDLAIVGLDGEGYQGWLEADFEVDGVEERVSWTLDCGMEESSCGAGCTCGSGGVIVDRVGELVSVEEVSIESASGRRYQGRPPLSFGGGPGSCCGFSAGGEVVVE